MIAKNNFCWFRFCCPIIISIFLLSTGCEPSTPGGNIERRSEVEEGDGQLGLHFDDNTNFLGIVKARKNPFIREINLVNRGHEELVVKSSSTSCGCMSLKRVPEVFKPGITRVAIQIDSPKPGMMQSSEVAFKILRRDGSSGIVTSTIELFAVKENGLAVSPGFIALEANQISSEIIIARGDHALVESLTIACDGAEFIPVFQRYLNRTPVFESGWKIRVVDSKNIGKNVTLSSGTGALESIPLENFGSEGYQRKLTLSLGRVKYNDFVEVVFDWPERVDIKATSEIFEVLDIVWSGQTVSIKCRNRVPANKWHIEELLLVDLADSKSLKSIDVAIFSYAN